VLSAGASAVAVETVVGASVTGDSVPGMVVVGDAGVVVVGFITGFFVQILFPVTDPPKLSLHSDEVITVAAASLKTGVILKFSSFESVEPHPNVLRFHPEKEVDAE
jgi:hypothetical protein